MVRINRIGIGSAFKVFALVSALMWAIFGILYLLMIFAVADAATMTTNSFQTTTTSMDGLGMAAFFMYACGVPLYAIMGGIFGAALAFAYNIISGWVGGLELEVEGTVLEPTNPIYKPERTIHIPDRQF